ncbi:hypothetical protein CHARACLAT_014800 [Characodon lateralis]|uniref:Uncharacterized protein n=1 Tax=Characodon lateralis TaxID=208331 RepID=A0ABU7EWK6_9TELE|nr:hypothetical protein [Characodon lateralis]
MIAHCSPYPVPLEAVWKRQDVARAVLLFGHWRHRKSAVTPFPSCAGTTSDLALCLAVAPSWRGTLAKLLLPTT